MFLLSNLPFILTLLTLMYSPSEPTNNNPSSWIIPDLVPWISTSLPIGTGPFHKVDPNSKASLYSSVPGSLITQLAPGTESIPRTKL